MLRLQENRTFLRTRAGPSLDRIALYPKLHTLNVGVTFANTSGLIRIEFSVS